VISVVIPVLNEAARLPALLATLAAEPVACETIVVDGGSRDGSAEAAERAGAGLVLRAPRGRGVQLAAGAARARGGIVLLLHADSILCPGALVALQRRMDADPALVGGNFRLLFDGEDEISRWVERFYASIRRFGWFYGDSGIFIRRSVLEAIGGLRPLPLMEDWDLVRRMRAAGRIACIGDPPLRSSSRRFAGRGRAAILTGWVRIHLLYWAGLPPERLAALYDSARERAG
jgi:rSAM/selenodomain-associated transferase 2